MNKLLLAALIILALALGWWLAIRPEPAAVDSAMEAEPMILESIPAAAVSAAPGDSDPAAAADTSVEPEPKTSQQQQKKLFIDRLLPVIQQQNQNISQQRERLLQIASKLNALDPVTREEFRWIKQLALDYDLTPEQRATPDFTQELTRRVDIIPTGLALAQAALESAWGTSRFAIEGNNYFGQWCFREGCGMVPKQRPQGEHYEVQSFTSAQQSVAAYMLNLNGNSSYQSLRATRARLRAQDLPVEAIVLANGLAEYSSRGEAYVESIKAVIIGNQLGQYANRPATP